MVILFKLPSVSVLHNILVDSGCSLEQYCTVGGNVLVAEVDYKVDFAEHM